MRNFLFIILISTTNNFFAQNDSSNIVYGIAFNSNLSVYSDLVPANLSFSMSFKKHQFELGPKLFITKSTNYKRQGGLEFNYRYYPNSTENRFDLFFLVNAEFFNKTIDRTYIQGSPDPLYIGDIHQKSTRNYYSLTVGYGMQWAFTQKFYLSSNIGVGMLIEDYNDVRTSTNPNLTSTKGYLNEGINFIFGFGLGYRFK